MTSHWLDRIKLIFDADTGDLRQLALIAGENPSQFYRGTDLSKTDLRGQDLRGMDFAGAKISGCLVDRQTLVDPQFLPLFGDKQRLRQIYLSETTNELVYAYAREMRYVYFGWAYKNLLNLGAEVLSLEGDRDWLSIVSSLKEAEALFGVSRIRIVRVRMGEQAMSVIRSKINLFPRKAAHYDYVIAVGLLANRGIGNFSLRMPLSLIDMYRENYQKPILF